MSVYDKRRILRVYSDGKSYVISSQLIENEHLFIKLVDSNVCLNKINNEEWASMKSRTNSVRSASFGLILESYGCLGMLSTGNASMQRVVGMDETGNFLIFVKEASLVGTIRKFEIIRITDVLILPMFSDANNSAYGQQQNTNGNLNYHSDIK